MATKKDIGTALKDRLKPYKDSPDDLVWTNIEGELKKRKKRRALFFWFSGLGLAALFVSLMLGNPFNITPENDIKNQETETIKDNGNPDFLKSSETTTNNINSNDSIKTNQEINSNTTQNKNVSNDQQEPKTDDSEASEHIIVKANKQYHSIIHNNQNSTLKNKSKSKISNLSVEKNTSLDQTNLTKKHTTDNTIIATKKEKLYSKDTAIAKRDSLISANKKIRDSLQKERQSKKLASEEIKEKEEAIKDSIIEDDQSRWSITPQLTFSNYGAFNVKTTDNNSTNYGLLASYRMSRDTYLRVGVRKLNLNQTIDSLQRKVEYLEFPIEVKYAPFNTKVSPYATGGLSYFKLQEDSNNDTNNFEYRATMGINLGLGIETKVFNDLFFNIESNFGYQLKPFTQKNNVDPYIFSIHFGLEYRF